MTAWPSIHVTEYAGNFRITAGSGQHQYRRHKLNHSVSLKHQYLGCERHIPPKQERSTCSANFHSPPSPQSPLARPRSLRRLLRPGGTAAAGIMAGMAAAGAGAARASTALMAAIMAVAIMAAGVGL